MHDEIKWAKQQLSCNWLIWP